MGKVIDIRGQRFGRLVAQRQIGYSGDRKALWECLCDCGKTVNVVNNHALAKWESQLVPLPEAA